MQGSHRSQLEISTYPLKIRASEAKTYRRLLVLTQVGTTEQPSFISSLVFSAVCLPLVTCNLDRIMFCQTFPGLTSLLTIVVYVSINPFYGVLGNNFLATRESMIRPCN